MGVSEARPDLHQAAATPSRPAQLHSQLLEGVDCETLEAEDIQHAGRLWAFLCCPHPIDSLVDRRRDVIKQILVDLLRDPVASRARRVVVQGRYDRFASGADEPRRQCLGKRGFVKA